MNYRDLLNAAYVASENRQAKDGAKNDTSNDSTSGLGKTIVGGLGAAADFIKRESLKEESLKEDAGELPCCGRHTQAVERAAGLIGRLKSYVSAAENDLDVKRAAELDEIADSMTELCEIAAEK